MKTALVLASLLVATACSTEQQMRAVDPAGEPSAAPAASSMPTTIPAAPGAVRTRDLALVMDTGSPELCVGPVAESFPPQCQGLAMAGWDWADHHGVHEQQGDVRWGSFVVTGTFDGTTVTVTDAVPAALYDPMATPPEPEPGTPCQEPDGGWVVLDPVTTTPESMDATLNAAAALPGYAGAWLDQSINPADPQTEAANDPAKLIINVAVTQDLEGAEARLRETWGGMLCVSEATYTERELNDIALELQQLPGILSTSAAADVVHADVTYDDGSIQEWVDATYGAGRVEVSSALVDAG
jgi:hypothetical protein